MPEYSRYSEMSSKSRIKYVVKMFLDSWLWIGIFSELLRFCAVVPVISSHETTQILFSISAHTLRRTLRTSRIRNKN